MTTWSKHYMKMSELMENAKDHLPEGLFIDMYNQLKICKDDHDECDEAIRLDVQELKANIAKLTEEVKLNTRHQEIVMDKALEPIKETIDEQMKDIAALKIAALKGIGDRDKLIAFLKQRRFRKYDDIKAEVIERGKNYEALKKLNKCEVYQTPHKLSKELRVFLNIEEEVLISRIGVNRCIGAFVRENVLDKTIDVWGDSDASRKLKALLVPEEGDVITCFNLSKYLDKHLLLVPAPQPCLIDPDWDDG